MATWGPTVVTEDAREQQNGGGYTSTENPMKCNAHDTFSSQRHVDLFWFSGVTIPQGATINTATLRVYVYHGTLDNANLDVYCEDVDNSESLSSNADVWTRAQNNLTTNYTEWVEDDHGVGQKSIDIKSAVQEVIDRTGWVNGNALSPIFYCRSDATKYLSIYAVEQGSNQPELEIDYTESVTYADVTGELPATGTFDGVLKSFVSVAGIAEGTGTFSGELKPFVGAAGIVDGTGSFEGGLKSFVSVAGPTEGTGVFGGGLKSLVSTEGVIAGAGSFDGSLKSVISVGGSVNDTGTFDGALSSFVGLAGSVDSTGSLEGTLQGLSLLDGYISGVSDFGNPILSRIKQASSTIYLTSVFDGEVGSHPTFSGVTAASGSFDGVLSKFSSKSGSIAGSGSLDGTLKSSYVVDGNVDGTGVFSGSIKKTVTLDGEIAGSGGVLGNTFSTISAYGNVEGTSVFAGSLSMINGLSNTIVGSGSFDGVLLADRNQVVGNIAGTSALSADLFVRGLVDVVGGIAGTGALSANMLVQELASVVAGEGTFVGNLNRGASTAPVVSHILPTKVVYIYTKKEDIIYISPLRQRDTVYISLKPV